MSTKDGGPAFPVADYDHMVFEPKTVAETKRDLSGMSLRDYFAAKALPAILGGDMLDAAAMASKARGVRPEWGIAKAAYEMADAMIAARSQP